MYPPAAAARVAVVMSSYAPRDNVLTLGIYDLSGLGRGQTGADLRDLPLAGEHVTLDETIGRPDGASRDEQISLWHSRRSSLVDRVVQEAAEAEQ